MFGLDRRSLLPGLVVIALFVLWAILIPGVNGVLGYDDETVAGDVFALTDGIAMDAEPGWEVEQGLRTTDRTRCQSSGRARHGHKRHHVTQHILRAALDLAHELAAAGGPESPGVAHERAEVSRLRAELATGDRA